MELLVSFHSYLQQYGTKSLALYHALREAIVSGRLTAGVRLPSSRELAASYQISRGTVNTVYDMLQAEGYVACAVGYGTSVAFDAGSQPQDRCRQDLAERKYALSEWGQRIAALPLRGAADHSVGTKPEEETASKISFEIGKQDISRFPFEVWLRLLHGERRATRMPHHRDPFASEGFAGLREAVSRYLSRARGIAAAPEQIVIVDGSMQAIALLAQLLISPGEEVIVEEPGYAGIRRAVLAAGGVPLPSNEAAYGVMPDSGQARLAFITSGRQFPTGSALSMERRLALLRWAQQQEAVIIEDDYDSEFRHRGRPLEPLQTLDRSGCVVYLGTFSKTMLPELRVGYAVLPPGLVEPFVKAKQLYGPHPTAPDVQRALARFIAEGHYERHLRRMKRIYGSRFQLLRTLLEEQLGHLFEQVQTDSGLHIFAWWKRELEEWPVFVKACSDAGVILSDTRGYFQGEYRPSACFGFSHLTEGQLKEGVWRMSEAWHTIRNKK